jgi:hypothetical protein
MNDDVVVLRPAQMPRQSVIRLQREINSIYLSYGPLHDLYHRLRRAAHRDRPTQH